MPVSIDIGTGNIIVARENDKGKTIFTHERNAFIHIGKWDAVKNRLKRTSISYTKIKDDVYVLGTAAYDYANIFGEVELRRPMSLGMLNPKERNSLPILRELIKELLGPPKVEDEICVYVTPSEPIDTESHTVYHEDVARTIIESFGYKAKNIKEAEALAYTGLIKENLTGIAISFGAGMANVVVLYQGLTALGFSVTKCIPAGNKVITKRGLINIEHVTKNDYTLTRKGTWAKVIGTSQKTAGQIYKFKAQGQCQFSTTGDHEILIKENNNWKWKRADKIKIGDKIQQPWPQTIDRRHVISWTNEKTKEYEKRDIFSEGYYVLGRYLGDGCVFKDSKTDRGITISCHIDDPSINELALLIEKVFNKKASISPRKKDNVTEVKIHDSGLAKWFRKNTYQNKEKIIPWDISELKENYLRFFIAGLIDSDGHINKKTNQITVEITSPSLAQALYLSLSKLGLKPSIHWRDRTNEIHFYKGRKIQSTKESFVIACKGYKCLQFIKWMENKQILFDRTEIEGCTIAKISSIESHDVLTDVYDLSIDDNSHSFCLAGCVVHNCGDYIDENAAMQTDNPVAHITALKENPVFNLDPQKEPLTRENMAVGSYYRFVIRNILTQIINLFNTSKGMPHFKEPIKIVCGGGTSMAKGFIPLFKDEFKKLEFPIDIKSFELVQGPLFAVAKGALSDAIIEEADN